MTKVRRLAAVLAFVAMASGVAAGSAQAPTARATGQAARTDGPYPTVAMHERKLGWDKSHHVEYFGDAQREARRVVVRGGKVYKPDGSLYPDTRSTHKNQGNYVMDSSGTFYLFDEWTTPTIRHSSIFAGGPVAGAGNIQVSGGRVVYIDGESGHYPTGRKQFANVLKELSAHGVDVAHIQHGR